MSKIDNLKISDLKQLAKDQSRKGLSIGEWKVLVKEFGTKHNLTDREAVEAARMSKRL